MAEDSAPGYRPWTKPCAWPAPEGTVAEDSAPGYPLGVRDAARLLRGLNRVQDMLSSLAASRFSASYDADHEVADSLLLGIGLRVAKLAGGLANPELLAEWRAQDEARREEQTVTEQEHPRVPRP